MIIIQKALIIKQERYLIGLRSENSKYFPLHWDFFGGKLEPNEDPLVGIVREIKEETSLIIKPFEIVGTYEFDLDSKGENTHRFVIYSTETFSGKIKLSNEHRETRWAAKDEILKMKIEPYMRKFFQ